MLFFAFCFVVGLLIGVASLRLLAVWTPRQTSQPINTPPKRHHP